MRPPFGYHESITTPKAARSVEASWSFTAETAGSDIVLPDGRCDIILKRNLADQAQPVLIVTGPATRAFRVRRQPGDHWIGVRLRPENGCAIWKEEIVRAEDRVVWGQRAHGLVPHLAGSLERDVTEAALSRAVQAILPGGGDARLTHAIDLLHASGGRLRIETLAEISGCSVRQINRMFRARVGLSAKTYAQLVRFHRTLRMILHQGLKIPEAAYEGGYADQAHLSRSFRRFGGFTSRIPRDLTLPQLFS